MTAPSSKKRNGDYSFISLENIEWLDNQQAAVLDFSLEAIQINENVTWSTDINLSLPVFIKNGGTLNITNGADVNITGDYLEQIKFVIESGGSLNITGAEENKSIFQSTQPNQEWKGIEIFDTGIINCSHIIIQDAMNPIKVISPTHFVSCTINNSEIIGNTITLNGNIEIQNSIFNDASLLIYTSNNGSALKRNVFLGQYHSDKFVQLRNPNNSYLEVINCTFNKFYIGLLFGGHNEQFGDRTNQIIVRNNIFSSCYSSIEFDYGQVSISYNNYYDNNFDENKGGNYLEEDPLYVDPDNNNFNLQWGSPCIDAGHPSSVYNDPDGTRNDMGAKYYHQSIITTSVIGGWQTLSVPVVVNDFTKTVVWPTANSNDYSFCGSGYITQSILQNGIGYYISFPSPQDISYIGNMLEQFCVPVCADWNIIGSITEEVPIATNVCLFPSGNSFTALVYIYQNGYHLVNNIIPGMGHWVKVAMAGSITVNSEPMECNSQESISEEGLDHFIITDSQGKKQDLYVANQSLNPSLGELDFSMPPPIPEIGFDARFESGEYIKLVSPDSGMIDLVINIETQSYPVNINWELNPENGITYSFMQGLGKQSNSHSGSAIITNSSNGKFKMSANANHIINKVDIPEEYMLGQNYPNPFNPSTTIIFDLPEKSFVSLKMYSINGEEVRTIVNEQMDAGRYHFLIDGNGLSSGVYLLRMISDDFVSTKKIIMMK